MKKNFTIKLATVLITAALPFAANALTSEQESALVTQIQTDPSAENIATILSIYPDELIDVITVLLNTTEADIEKVLEVAFTTYPEHANEIATIARKRGLSNQLITQQAILAGVDPTQIAEATAAGITTDNIEPIAPPTPPETGDNASGGNDVVSPN